MGEPYFKAKDIIVKNNVQVFSSNYSLYGDLSRRVMRTLKRFNSDIEVYSIDEAFMDLSNFPDNEIADVGREIRNTVLQWTGIPTSIGIAKTKTLSKIANHIAKKKQSGVTSLIGVENLDPILVGMPVHCNTVFLISLPTFTISSSGKFDKSINASSIEYTSMSELNLFNVLITLLDKSPYKE